RSVISASTASDGATQRMKKRCRARAMPADELGVNLETGLLQVLGGLGLRLFHGVGSALLLGCNALDRLVDLVADLRIDGDGAVFHIAGLAAELQHFEEQCGDVLVVQGQYLLELWALDHRQAA